MKNLIIILFVVAIVTKGFSQEVLSPEIIEKAEDKIKEMYKDSTRYLLVKIHEVYEQNQDKELFKLCGSKKIKYSAHHEYFMFTEKVNEFIQFDKDMKVLCIIPMQDMMNLVMKQLEEEINIEELIQYEGWDDTINSDIIKGDWIVQRYQMYGDYGYTNFVGDQYIGDTIKINKQISFQVENNEMTKMAINSTSCPLETITSRKVATVDRFCDYNFSLNPFLIDIEKQDEIYLLNTYCKAEIFKQIVYNKTKQQLLFYLEGMILITKRVEK